MRPTQGNVMKGSQERVARELAQDENFHQRQKTVYAVTFTFNTGSSNLVGPFYNLLEAHEFINRWQKHVAGTDISIRAVPLETPRMPEDCQPFEKNVRGLRG